MIGLGSKRKMKHSTVKPCKIRKVGNIILPTEILFMIMSYLEYPTLTILRLVCRRWNRVASAYLDQIMSKTKWMIIITEDEAYGVIGGHIDQVPIRYQSIHRGVGGNTALQLYRNAQGASAYLIPNLMDYLPKVVIGRPLQQEPHALIMTTFSSSIIEGSCPWLFNGNEELYDSTFNDELLPYEQPDFNFLSLPGNKRRSILGDYDLLSYTYYSDED